MMAEKTALRVRAWQLGAGTEMEKEMVAQGKIKRRNDGAYEVFSMEATGETGQIAKAGDYFKLDDSGKPYPNDKAFFESNHESLGGEWYLQKARPLRIWRADLPMEEPIRFLLDQKTLVIDPDHPDRYFSAQIWGTLETAAQDAVIILWDVQRDGQGQIRHVEFSFVDRRIFGQTYRILDESGK